MPSIKVTPAKGLFQTSGTSAVPNGSLSGHLLTIVLLTGTTVLTAEDSGKIFEIDQDAAFTVTLPSAASVAGWNARFVLTDRGTNDVKIDSGTSNGIQGQVSDPTTGIIAIDNNLVKFANNVAVVGDFVDLYSNGTRYIVDGKTGAEDGIAGANS